MTWKGIVGKSFTQTQFAVYMQSIPYPATAWRPEFVVLHNTGAPRLDQWHKVSGADRMANLQTYYRDEEKWSGGPHLFIADDLIWVFTPLTVPGVHSPSWNQVSIGVEMVGDYTAEPFSAAVRSNTIAALVSLHSRLSLNPALLKFHYEDPLTTHKECPGKNVSKADIQGAVTRVLGALQRPATASATT